MVFDLIRIRFTRSISNTDQVASKKYCNSLTEYSRRQAIEVNIGGIPLGGNQPIRVQSMTTIDTMDTQGSVEQTKRMVDSGCEYVRITAPSLKEAANLENIKNELRAAGINVPLVADIHFTPNAAELAATIVEKVRVNPGNYADKKKFENIEYTDETYQEELARIKEKFAPLVTICKENGTAMRIGTNHGSLSDRIMSRFGDTPLGMVESALEFLRICVEMDYHDIVISMKASNTRVMVQAYRLLVNKLEEEGLPAYPFHLGVTEAGEGEDGRIKSAVGIGALLEDGLGDTVRVSLTEEPEFEAPVAASLINRYSSRAGHNNITPLDQSPVDPFNYHRRETIETDIVGGQNVPRVIADFSDQKVEVKDLKNVGHFYLPEPDKWRMNDLGVDFIYTGTSPVDFMLPNGLKEIIDFDTFKDLDATDSQFPLFNTDQIDSIDIAKTSFLKVDSADLSIVEKLKILSNVTLILTTTNDHAMAEMRRFIFELIVHEVKLPVILDRKIDESDISEFQLQSATDVGGLLIDGLGDGVILTGNGDKKVENDTAFGILQAARTRMTKTEYISCPSCGRTLFDLQETTAMIRKRTDHLKGVKIGIMGCIVNGPGEMADADYGYVGSGKGKITLYKGQEVVKKAVPSENAVDELIEIIREDGQWVEPAEVAEAEI
ncbi:(E)-4-hydroxy-3-methylbut-2-enyl-diphosphate synthase [Reichenbachiella versicolor]|uniref:(E)-4-hydroxy-3-methylbut-2-enyl-diphosphate synthase n=1 Tax=Reichenbachiella versicolor TaxID=1821036 RepID=UPI000D6E4AAB|nr:(E)-4-hydroxy-3-methylbut-2-enyl-diphosphate synthase [Reichenbachiella versicolor]